MSSLIGAGGQLFQGAQQYQNSKQQAKYYKSQAKRVEKEGKAEASRIRGRARRTLATQRARMAAAGIDISGSAIDIQYDSAIQSEVDAMTSIYKSNIQAADLRTQAEFTRAAGRAALFSSALGAGGSVASGFGNRASQSNPQFGSNFGGQQ